MHTPTDAKIGVSEVLAAGLAEIELPVDPEQVALLVAFTDQVFRWGTRLNLSGHRDRGSIARRLVLDAAALSGQLPELGALNDLGSGAGFPGIPIAILRPSCAVRLVEARERRFHFLRDVARRLSIANLSVERGRLEVLDPTPAAGAVAQAVAPANQVLEWMMPWVEPAGWLALPVSQKGDLPAGGESVTGIEIRDYQVPLGGPSRRLWLARKVEHSAESDIS